MVNEVNIYQNWKIYLTFDQIATLNLSTKYTN